MRRFNPSSSHPARAVQCWQILLGSAMNRQTVTYAGLAELMFKRQAAGVLAQILAHVAYYCIDSELPPLTAIVVRTSGGEPGPGIPVNQASIDELREDVYQCDWFDVYPPSEEDLAASYAKQR